MEMIMITSHLNQTSEIYGGKNRKIVFLYVQIIVKKIIQQHKTQLFEFCVVFLLLSLFLLLKKNF